MRVTGPTEWSDRNVSLEPDFAPPLLSVARTTPPAQGGDIATTREAVRCCSGATRLQSLSFSSLSAAELKNKLAESTSEHSSAGATGEHQLQQAA